MTARLAFGGELKVLFSAKASIATATTTTFGSDVYLPGATGWSSAMRVLVIFDGVITGGAGTTDSTSYIIQDADGTSAAIGTPADVPAANLAFAPAGNTLAAGLGDRQVLASVLLQPSRPWLRLKVSRASGTTDTLWTKATVLGIPQGVL